MPTYDFDLSARTYDERDPEAYDFLTFEERDEIDAAEEDRVRAAVFGLPARPGTRR